MSKNQFLMEHLDGCLRRRWTMSKWSILPKWSILGVQGYVKRLGGRIFTKDQEKCLKASKTPKGKKGGSKNVYMQRNGSNKTRYHPPCSRNLQACAKTWKRIRLKSRLKYQKPLTKPLTYQLVTLSEIFGTYHCDSDPFSP